MFIVYHCKDKAQLINKPTCAKTATTNKLIMNDTNKAIPIRLNIQNKRNERGTKKNYMEYMQRKKNLELKCLPDSIV